MLERILPGRAAVPSLKSFQAELARHPGHYVRSPRYEAVPIGRIVGSVNRYRDFDLNFRPSGRGGSADSAVRLDRLTRLMDKGGELPAIILYELDGEYYVEDGHHRILASKKLGRQFVDAYVKQVIAVSRATATPQAAAA